MRGEKGEAGGREGEGEVWGEGGRNGASLAS